MLGYNPKKPGRPSHVYHTYRMAGLRLVLDVDVAPGNEHASSHAAPGLWVLLDRIPRNSWPAFLRGDSGFGTEAVMREAEQRGLRYLFKLRLTANVKKLIKKTFSKNDWTDAGQGWQGREGSLRLEGWSRQRQVVILRRRLKEGMAIAGPGAGQLALSFVEIGPGAEVYEYGVLVTSLDEEVLTLAQLYRDRADSENPFDELKNQWGWGGFTTRDLARCQIMARFIALIYNWWNLFVRLAEPDKHLEAITSRPLLLSAICRAQPPCEADNAEGGQLARQGWMGGERALRHCPLPARDGPICGAVDRCATLAPDSRPRGAGLPQWPSAQASNPAHGSNMMQPMVDPPRKNRSSQPQTAGFRMIEMLVDLRDEFATRIGFDCDRFFHAGQAASRESDVNN